MWSRLGIVLGGAAMLAILLWIYRSFAPALGWGAAIAGSLTILFATLVAVVILYRIIRWVVKG